MMESNASTIWACLISKIGNAYGVAGLMGNLKAESALSPTNVQDSYEKSLGYTDSEYTSAVDSGEYANFVYDSVGYGLAQWTYWSRKKALQAYAKSVGASIGSMNMQLDFLIKELGESYGSVLKALKNATSVKEAAVAVLEGFEKPADRGASVQNLRTSYGQAYYDAFASGNAGSSGPGSPKTVSEVKASAGASYFDKFYAGAYTVTADSGLNVRDKPNSNKATKILVAIPKGTTVQNYGYYSGEGSVKWLYVQFAYEGVKYTGHAYGSYLKKS